MIIKTILTIIIIWIIFAIILPFLIMPNFPFKKLRKQNTKHIKKLAKQLKDKSEEKTLKNIYKYITQNYTGAEERYKLINYIKLFQYNADKNLKDKKQFLACHQQNWLITNLLINTGQIKRKKIKKRYLITKFATIHQYLIVKTKKGKFKVDPFYKVFQKLK